MFKLTVLKTGETYVVSPEDRSKILKELLFLHGSVKQSKL